MQECREITKQLGVMVERVMTLAYLDAGQTNFEERNFNLGELAQGCATVIRPLAAAQEIHLDVDIDQSVIVRTDADKLREVIMNLLHNAVEYNRTGGQIFLRVFSEQAHAVIEVEDTGIGMTEEIRERIFERFFRADSSRTAAGAHAGLGLAIVKEYVHLMKGTITVESTPNVGTTFRVVIDACLGEERQADDEHLLETPFKRWNNSFLGHDDIGHPL